MEPEEWSTACGSACRMFRDILWHRLSSSSFFPHGHELEPHAEWLQVKMLHLGFVMVSPSTHRQLALLLRELVPRGSYDKVTDLYVAFEGDHSHSQEDIARLLTRCVEIMPALDNITFGTCLPPRLDDSVLMRLTDVTVKLPRGVQVVNTGDTWHDASILQQCQALHRLDLGTEGDFDASLPVRGLTLAHLQRLAQVNVSCKVEDVTLPKGCNVSLYGREEINQLPSWESVPVTCFYHDWLPSWGSAPAVQDLNSFLGRLKLDTRFSLMIDGRSFGLRCAPITLGVPQLAHVEMLSLVCIESACIHVPCALQLRTFTFACHGKGLLSFEDVVRFTDRLQGVNLSFLLDKNVGLLQDSQGKSVIGENWAEPTLITCEAKMEALLQWMCSVCDGLGQLSKCLASRGWVKEIRASMSYLDLSSNLAKVCYLACTPGADLPFCW
jgi:hypothetical protein